ncbi:hypothetical protein WJX81_007825 [Elliptochloris bilobata]|uniref:Fungal lipase-type domain-containing protein n=1 Tax=Elliptochloris bilobata TaxID=381761 RepID=A0AAW1QV40_9CHLO
MAAPVAAAGAAVALYFWARRNNSLLCGFAGPSAGAAATLPLSGRHRAPNGTLDALYFLAEALRYTWGETLGRWSAADLLIGLVYLARRSTGGQLADVARHGQPAGLHASASERAALVTELRAVQRLMAYCRALRQPAALRQRMAIEAGDLLLQAPRAGVLKPSYVIVRDRQLASIVLAIRGTHSVKDMFTSLTGASKPHHVVDEDGVVLGYSHFGMLAAARWILQETLEPLKAALAEQPTFQLRIVGHSLGAGAAALLTMMLRDASPELAQATCLAIACPACMTLELARSCAPYVTTIVNNADIVPTISPGSADALREEVVQSAWYEAFRADMRSSAVVRAVEGSLGRVGAATVWTTARLASASSSLTACYRRRAPVQAKRRSSDDRGSAGAKDSDDEGGLPQAGACVPSAGSDAGVGVEVASEWVTSEAQETKKDATVWKRALASISAMGSAAAPSTSAIEAPAEASTSEQPRTWQRVAVQAASASGQAYRRAGDLISRGFLRGCQPRPTGNPANAMEAPAKPAAVDDEPLSPVAVASMEEVERSEPSGDMPGVLPSPRDLDRDMRAVAAAVEVAEREEAAMVLPRRASSACGTPARLDSTALEGEAAAEEAASAPRGMTGEAEERWKRMTYPAGRILHLGARRRYSVDLAMMGMDGYGGEFTLSDIDEPQEASAPEQERFVLLEGIPQEAYGRVRLCKSMLNDHYIPAYLRSLDSVIATLEMSW